MCREMFFRDFIQDILNAVFTVQKASHAYWELRGKLSKVYPGKDKEADRQSLRERFKTREKRLDILGSIALNETGLEFLGIEDENDTNKYADFFNVLFLEFGYPIKEGEDGRERREFKKTDYKCEPEMSEIEALEILSDFLGINYKAISDYLDGCKNQRLRKEWDNLTHEITNIYEPWYEGWVDGDILMDEKGKWIDNLALPEDIKRKFKKYYGYTEEVGAIPIWAWGD